MRSSVQLYLDVVQLNWAMKTFQFTFSSNCDDELVNPNNLSIEIYVDNCYCYKIKSNNFIFKLQHLHSSGFFDCAHYIQRRCHSNVYRDYSAPPIVSIIPNTVFAMELYPLSRWSFFSDFPCKEFLNPRLGWFRVSRGIRVAFFVQYRSVRYKSNDLFKTSSMFPVS